MIDTSSHLQTVYCRRTGYKIYFKSFVDFIGGPEYEIYCTSSHLQTVGGPEYDISSSHLQTVGGPEY